MPRINPAARRALTEQRKAQILAAAAKVFAAKGFERATIADIARAARMAEGSIYNYFKNKNDLLISLPRQALEPTMESVSAHMSMSGAAEPVPPEQVLATAARNMVATIRKQAPIFRILISALPSMKQAAREKYMEQVVMYGTGVLERYFQELMERGVIRPGLNPKILARSFVGMFFPFVMLGEVLQIGSEAEWDYDKLADEIVPLFLHGILAEPAERKTK